MLCLLAAAQLEVVRQDAGRLNKENSQLHEQLIREGERYEALQRESYTRTKRLEDQVRLPRLPIMLARQLLYRQQQ